MRSALGKGLNALISEETLASVSATPAQGSVSVLPLSQIKPNPKQPRRDFPAEALKELSDSIKQRGLLQPILVSPSADGTYEIIAGERRWRAAQQAGLTEIPAIIRPGSESERFEMALVENIQREDLNPIELAQGYRRLREEFSLTQEEIAGALGKDRAVIANTLRLLSLPDSIQQALKTGIISMGHARALAAMGESTAQETLFQKIQAENLSVRSLEKEVRLHKTTAREHLRTGGFQGKPPEVKAVEEELQRTLTRKVELQSSDGTKGWLKLEFYSLDDLDHLLKQLRVAAGA